jgi:hypothetical protein
LVRGEQKGGRRQIDHGIHEIDNAYQDEYPEGDDNQPPEEDADDVFHGFTA